MSDEKKPFAWCRQVGDETVVEFDNGIVAARFGCDVASQAGYTADAINAAVERERREAAVKALRQAAHDILREPASSRRNAFSWISERAERIERGEQ